MIMELYKNLNENEQASYVSAQTKGLTGTET